MFARKFTHVIKIMFVIDNIFSFRRKNPEAVYWSCMNLETIIIQVLKHYFFNKTDGCEKTETNKNKQQQPVTHTRISKNKTCSKHYTVTIQLYIDFHI